MFVSRIRLRNLDRFRTELSAIPSQILQAAAAQFTEEAEETITDAKTTLVPKDTGNLANSGTVLPPEFQGLSVTVRYGFGGPAASYAFWVHELTDIFGLTPGGGSRTTSPRRFRRVRGKRVERKFVGQAKYLETAIDDRAPGRRERLAAGIRRKLRRLR